MRMFIIDEQGITTAGKRILLKQTIKQIEIPDEVFEILNQLMQKLKGGEK